MHRLTQAILRDRLTPGQADATRALVGRVLAASNPGDAGDPVAWPGWARLLPHLPAIDPGASDDPGVRNLAVYASWYLLMRGDFPGGHDLASDLHRQWRHRLGEDDRHVLLAANSLAESYRHMDRYAEARRLHEDILARRRQYSAKTTPPP